MSHSYNQLSGIRNGDRKNKGHRSRLCSSYSIVKIKQLKSYALSNLYYSPVDYEFINWNKIDSTFSAVSLRNI